MCELLGMSAKKRLDATALLREFFSHAERHPHGWGLARFADGKQALVDKEPFKATASEHLRHLLGDGVEERTLLAHIRFATVGNLEYSNCHPFSATDNSGRTWTLVHNGTIFGGETLNEYIGIQYGETDSERVLLHLVSRIDHEQIRRRRHLSEEERFDVLSSEIAALAKGNKLNLLIYDGEVMYAHSNFKGALHYSKSDDALTFSTNPLQTGDWTPLPFTRLVAIKNGEFVREGTPHGNEYIHNPEDYRFVYMNFARL